MYIYIYIYVRVCVCVCVFVNVFMHYIMIMYFGRSKREASAGHGVVLYQSGCSKGFHTFAGDNGAHREPSASPEPAQCHKCHACHAKCRGDNGAHREPSASPEPAQCHKCHACHASEGQCRQVPRLPRKTKVDVTKCHACGAK